MSSTECPVMNEEWQSADPLNLSIDLKANLLLNSMDNDVKSVNYNDLEDDTALNGTDEVISDQENVGYPATSISDSVSPDLYSNLATSDSNPNHSNMVKKPSEDTEEEDLNSSCKDDNSLETNNLCNNLNTEISNNKELASLSTTCSTEGLNSRSSTENETKQIKFSNLNGSTGRINSSNDPLDNKLNVGHQSIKNNNNGNSKSDVNQANKRMTTSTSSTTSLRRSRASPAPINRIPLVVQSLDKKAKRCRFYRSGDQWFPGSILAVSADKHRSWDALLVDITRLLEHPQYLASGVRYIFTLEGGKMESLSSLEDRGEYVASSTDSFKAIDYKMAQLPQWRLKTKRNEALHVKKTPDGLIPSPVVRNSLVDDGAKGRIVTVFSNGQRPRKATKVLLNRKTARSLDQVKLLGNKYFLS